MIRLQSKPSLLPVVVAILAATAACGSKPGPASTQDQEVLNLGAAGVVQIDELSDGEKPFEQHASAVFIQASASDVCTITSTDPCRVISCPGSRGIIQRSDAGVISVSVGSSSIKLQPKFNGYLVTLEPSVIFAGGDSVEVSAAGGSVPSFAVSVTGPSAVNVTAPVEQSLALDSTQDLPVAWSGTSTGEVVFQLKSIATSPLTTLECRFPGSGSSGSIPAGALALVPKGGYTADLFTRSRKVVSAGSWSVAVEARYFAGTAAKVAYTRPATVK